MPRRIFDADPDLKAEADAERAKHRQRTNGAGEEPFVSIQASPYVWKDPASLPRRQWLYGQHLIRGFVSTTVALGGRGKTSLIVAEALAMVTGRALLDDKPAGRLRVWLISTEDPQEELERRIAATCLRYSIGKDDLGDRLFIDVNPRPPLMVATDEHNGIKVAFPVVNALRSEIIRRKIDVVQIDPLVDTHAVAENDNIKIAAVMRIWAEIARDANCAIDLVNHVRKPNKPEQTLIVEDARGASTLIYKARNARVLNGMTKKEAKAAEVDQYRLYFSMDNGKANLAPANEKKIWRRTTGILLGNASRPDDPGDEIGVVEPWRWPDAFNEVSVEDTREVQRRIAKGDWRANTQAENWAGKLVAEVLGLDLGSEAARATVRTQLKKWLENRVLKVVERSDKNRKRRGYIEVDEWLP